MKLLNKKYKPCSLHQQQSTILKKNNISQLIKANRNIPQQKKSKNIYLTKGHSANHQNILLNSNKYHFKQNKNLERLSLFTFVPYSKNSSSFRSQYFSSNRKKIDRKLEGSSTESLYNKKSNSPYQQKISKTFHLSLQNRKNIFAPINFSLISKKRHRLSQQNQNKIFQNKFIDFNKTKLYHQNQNLQQHNKLLFNYKNNKQQNNQNIYFEKQKQLLKTKNIFKNTNDFGILKFQKVVIPKPINYPKYLRKTIKKQDIFLNEPKNINKQKKIRNFKKKQLDKQLSDISSQSDSKTPQLIIVEQEKQEKLQNNLKVKQNFQTVNLQESNKNLNKIKKQVTIIENNTIDQQINDNPNIQVKQKSGLKNNQIYKIGKKGQLKDQGLNIGLSSKAQKSSTGFITSINQKGFIEGDRQIKLPEQIKAYQSLKVQKYSKISQTTKKQNNETSLLIGYKKLEVNKKIKNVDSSSLQQISSLILTISNIDERSIYSKGSRKQYYMDQNQYGQIDFDKYDNFEKNQQVYIFPEPKNVYQLFPIRKQRKRNKQKIYSKGAISLKYLKSSKQIPNNEDRKVKFILPQNGYSIKSKNPNKFSKQLLDQQSSSNSLQSSQFSNTPRFNKQQSNQSLQQNILDNVHNNKRAKIITQIYNTPKEYRSQVYKYKNTFNLTTQNLIYTQKQLNLQKNTKFLNNTKLSHNVIKILLHIDNEIIQKIIETRNQHSSKNGIWIFCHGIWRCFIVKFDKQIYKSILEALQQAAINYYNQNLENLDIEVIAQMISGLSARKIQIEKRNYAIQHIIRQLKKGSFIYGITKKNQIYQIQDVQEARNRNQKIIKIKQQQSTFWLKEDQFYNNFTDILAIQYRKKIFWTYLPIIKPDRPSRLFYRLYSQSVSTGSIRINYQRNLSPNNQMYVSLTLYQQDKHMERTYIKMVNHVHSKKITKPSGTNLSIMSANSRSKRTINIEDAALNRAQQGFGHYSLQFTIKGFYYLLVQCNCVQKPCFIILRNIKSNFIIYTICEDLIWGGKIILIELERES